MELDSVHLQNLCRICFKVGSINIWTHQVLTSAATNAAEAEEATTTQVPCVRMLEIFQDFKNVTDDFGFNLQLICVDCLLQLQASYEFYCQMLEGSAYLHQLWADMQTQQKDDDILEQQQLPDETYPKELPTVDLVDDMDLNADDLIVEDCCLTEEEEHVLSLAATVADSEVVAKSQHKKTVTATKVNHNNLLENVSLVISHFLPAIDVDANDHEGVLQSNNLRTMEYGAIETAGTMLAEGEENNVAAACLYAAELNDNDDPASQDAVYLCQYCQQAFSSSSYLRSHTLARHVCKHCTKGFVKTTDLYEHIRKDHSKHKCAVCQKNFSSGSNLRWHLKRMHGIFLPMQVALLDCKPNVNGKSN